MEGDAGSRSAIAPASVRQLSSKSVVYRQTCVRAERVLPSCPRPSLLSQLPHDMSMTMTMPSTGGGRGQGGGAGLLSSLRMMLLLKCPDLAEPGTCLYKMYPM